MLHPSYAELMEILNSDQNVDNKITSRYIIVIAASKRARQLIDNAKDRASIDKAVSLAVNEMAEGKLLIKSLKENINPIHYDEHEEF